MTASYSGLWWPGHWVLSSQYAIVAVPQGAGQDAGRNFQKESGAF